MKIQRKNETIENAGPKGGGCDGYVRTPPSPDEPWKSAHCEKNIKINK